MEAIHSMARGGHMQWLKWTSIVLCVVLAAVGLYTGKPSYFMFMILPVLIACSAHQVRPHIRAASKAIHRGKQSEGLVEIEIEHSSDSETFRATVGSDSSRQWRFEFIPIGWTPVAGQTPATLYSLQDLKWPALIEVQDGVMYPRYTPEQVSH